MILTISVIEDNIIQRFCFYNMYTFSLIDVFVFNLANEASSWEVAFTRTASLFRLSIILVNYQWNVRGTPS